MSYSYKTVVQAQWRKSLSFISEVQLYFLYALTAETMTASFFDKRTCIYQQWPYHGEASMYSGIYQFIASLGLVQ